LIKTEARIFLKSPPKALHRRCALDRESFEDFLAEQEELFVHHCERDVHFEIIFLENAEALK